MEIASLSRIVILSIFDHMCDSINCTPTCRILLCWWSWEPLRFHAQGWLSIQVGTDHLVVFNYNKKPSILVVAGLISSFI